MRPFGRVCSARLLACAIGKRVLKMLLLSVVDYFCLGLKPPGDLIRFRAPAVIKKIKRVSRFDYVEEYRCFLRRA